MSAQVTDTINQNMGSAISLLYPVALMNTGDPKLQATFFDVENGSAIAGFRRQVANFGVMLVHAQYGRNNQVEISKNDNKMVNGTYNYVLAGRQDPYIETNEGLLGSEVKDGYRERVNNKIALEKIETIRNAVDMRYEVKLSPGTLDKFFTTRYKEVGGTWRDKKVNMQFTAGLPAGTAVAVAEKIEGNIQMVTKVPTLSGPPKLITSFVDSKNSRVPANRIQPGRVYLIQPVFYDKEKGIRTVNVLRTYKEGVRVAIQGFNMGLIRPGDRGYDVNPDKANGIVERTVMDMPFIPNQNKKVIAGAPMLTFDVDMIASLMKTLSAYPVVTMKFKDSSTGVYFHAEGNEYLPTIQAIVGPTIQYIRGRIWLP